MKLFTCLNPRLDTDKLVSIEIRFGTGGRGFGKLMLDNIGFYGLISPNRRFLPPD